MKNVKVNFDVWIQLLGMLGVLGGLVFVGLEMQQSQRIALAAQQQERASISVDYFAPLIESGISLQQVFFEDSVDFSNPEEVSGFENIIHVLWFIFENDFYQYTQGLMDEQTWEAKLAGVRLLYNKCHARQLFESRRSIFSSEFRSIVDTFTDECAD